METSQIVLTVLYNNVAHDPGLEESWGMSCLIEGLKKTILFDTGGEGRILISNMARLGKRPDQVEAVVLSHAHGDHTGGLGAILQRCGKVEIYVPKSFPDDFKRRVQETGAKVVSLDRPARIAGGVYSTGEMGLGIKEQALILQVQEGLVVLTGCAHPGVVNVVRRAREVCPGQVHLVGGGFHLSGASAREVEGIIGQLKALGVRKVGPSHCTGRRAIEMFRQAWREDFVPFGCGAIVRLDPPAGRAPEGGGLD